MEQDITGDDLTVQTPNLTEVKQPSLESVNEFKELLNEVVVRFFEANKGVPAPLLMPVAVSTMLLFPWTWLVDGFGRTPDEFEQAVLQEVRIIKDFLQPTTQNEVVDQNNNGENNV